MKKKNSENSNRGKNKISTINKTKKNSTSVKQVHNRNKKQPIKAQRNSTKARTKKEDLKVRPEHKARERKVVAYKSASKNIRRKKKKPIVKITRKMQGKLVLLFSMIVLALFGLNLRLTYINSNSGDKYTIKVLAQQRYESKALPYQRGDITDRNGVVLATSEKVYNMILDPKIMLSDDRKYLDTTLTALNGCFGYNVGELNSIISSNQESSYVVYKKGLTYQEIEEFINLQSGNTKERPEWFPKEQFATNNIQGVWFEEEYKRVYPYGTLACDLLGFTNRGDVGTWGIEQYYNDELNGTNGRTYGYLNSDSDLEKMVKPATDGNTIVTTIDINLQMMIEKHLQQYMDEVGAKNIAVMLMNPNNGEILAEASAPFFDLNNPRDLTAYFTEEELETMSSEDQSNFLYSLWKNFCLSEVYEPGSTGKPFTVAAGLEEGRLFGDETFLCQGYLTVGDYDIHCHNRNGDGIVTLKDSIKYSCNVALMDIAMDMGKETFIKYQKIFNFGSKTGIDLPGEESGLCYTLERMDASSLASNSFGQNYNVTMTQLAAAFCSLINGGYYYQPHVMKKVLNPSGGTIQTAESLLIKETVSKDTTKLLNQFLYETVEEGTGIKVKIEGYSIGGKTGTAEKHPRDEGRYLVSFIGFVPVEDPQLMIYTVIDEPNLEDQADAAQATRLTHNILLDVLPYMGIFSSLPTEPEEETTPETTQSEEKTPEETSMPTATPVYNEIYEGGKSFIEPNTGTVIEPSAPRRPETETTMTQTSTTEEETTIQETQTSEKTEE
jgi:stage V sporulation protein D (sporulation-specific penicillin-binding protein)